MQASGVKLELGVTFINTIVVASESVDCLSIQEAIRMYMGDNGRLLRLEECKS